jgi:hypothetical protein
MGSRQGLETFFANLSLIFGLSVLYDGGIIPEKVLNNRKDSVSTPVRMSCGVMPGCNPRCRTGSVHDRRVRNAMNIEFKVVESDLLQLEIICVYLIHVRRGCPCDGNVRNLNTPEYLKPVTVFERNFQNMPLNLW